MHQQEQLSFKNVVVFNLDEYYPMPPHQLQSYARFMKDNLFDHIDINPANVHIPDGTVPKESVLELCRNYEANIRKHGGIDIQLLGIGGGGHLGFNEPGFKLNLKKVIPTGSSAKSVTRLVHLDRKTRKAHEADFFGADFVPKEAITLGISNIIGDTKRVFLLAFGEHKGISYGRILNFLAKIIRRCVEDAFGEDAPASFLQTHKNAQVC